MTKTAVVQARVEPRLKCEAEAVLCKFGLSVSEYINMALSQMVLEERIPFSSHIPQRQPLKDNIRDNIL